MMRSCTFFGGRRVALGVASVLVASGHAGAEAPFELFDVLGGIGGYVVFGAWGPYR